MSDSTTINTVPAEKVINPFKGRIPDPDNLEAKIGRIKKIIARAEKFKTILPDLEEKLRIISDPNFSKMTEERQVATLESRTKRAETLLASLPGDVVAAILAKMGASK